MAESLINLEDSLANEIKENEGGLVLEPYKLEYTERDGDSIKENTYTVGYGTQISNDEYNNYMSLNEQDKKTFVENKFNQKYSQAKEDADIYMKANGISNAPQSIKDSVVEMAFNMGRGSLKDKKGLMSFKGFAKAIRKGDYARAADELRYINPDVKEKGNTSYYNQVGPKGDQLESESRVGRIIDKVLSNLQ